MSIIHTVDVKNVFVHFDPPHMSEQLLEHPPDDEGEYLTRCSVGKLLTEKCIRGKERLKLKLLRLYMFLYVEGTGYLTTVREKEIADKKLAECKKIIIFCIY